jgi:hypothetical protein
MTLMGIEPDGYAGFGAVSAGSREDRFPGVGLDRLTNLGEPEDCGLLRRPVIGTDHEPTSLIGSQGIDADRASGTERYPERTRGRSTNEDRPFDRAHARSCCELGDGHGPFHPDIGGDLLQQAARHQHAPPAITLGQRRRQRQPGLVARRVGEKSGEFGGQQKRRLFEPQAGRHQQLGKQRITCAIAIAGTGALGASDGQTAKSDIAENTILAQ